MNSSILEMKSKENIMIPSWLIVTTTITENSILVKSINVSLNLKMNTEITTVLNRELLNVIVHSLLLKNDQII